MKLPRLFVALVCLFFSLAFTPSVHAEEKTPPPSEQAPANEQKPEAQEKPQARREDIEPATLTDARTALKTARDDRDKAEAAVETATKAQAAAEAERDEARKQISDLTEKLSRAEASGKATDARLSALIDAVKVPLALTEEQVNHLVSDNTIIPAAIESLAGRKAVEIAATQGVPPVITSPGASTDDDTKAAFAAAAAEPDPRKRGMLFQQASAKLAKQAGKN